MLGLHNKGVKRRNATADQNGTIEEASTHLLNQCATVFVVPVI